VPASIFELIDQLAKRGQPRGWWDQSCASSRYRSSEQDRPGPRRLSRPMRARGCSRSLRGSAAASRKRGPGSGRLARAIDPHTRRFGDESILSEASTVCAFLRDPASACHDLPRAVTHLVGRIADRATYDALRRSAARPRNTDRARTLLLAAASALDSRLPRTRSRLSHGRSSHEPHHNLIFRVAGGASRARFGICPKQFPRLGGQARPSFAKM